MWLLLFSAFAALPRDVFVFKLTLVFIINTVRVLIDRILSLSRR